MQYICNLIKSEGHSRNKQNTTNDLRDEKNKNVLIKNKLIVNH